MHEISIVQSLIRLAENELEQKRLSGPVKSLTIRVGYLSGAQPEAISFAFGIIADESVLAGANLNIIRVKPVIICRECGKTSESEELVFECPKCGSREIDIAGGDDLNLETIELAEA